MKWELAIVAATVLAVAAFWIRPLTGTPVTAAMVFTRVGVSWDPVARRLTARAGAAS